MFMYCLVRRATDELHCVRLVVGSNDALLRCYVVKSCTHPPTHTHIDIFTGVHTTFIHDMYDLCVSSLSFRLHTRVYTICTLYTCLKHTQTHANTHTNTRKHTQTLSLSLSLSHTHTHTHALKCTCVHVSMFQLCMFMRTCDLCMCAHVRARGRVYIRISTCAIARVCVRSCVCVCVRACV